jgi:hypothetical protein
MLSSLTAASVTVTVSYVNVKDIVDNVDELDEMGTSAEVGPLEFSDS